LRRPRCSRSSGIAVSPDGRQIAAAFALKGDDIMIVTPGPTATTVEPWLRTPHVEMWPAFSPDGRWLAYGSDASGRFEVFVRPYPGLGQATQVSVHGGGSPAWNTNGRELFFVSAPDSSGAARLMAVDVAPGLLPRVGEPRTLFALDPADLEFDCRPVRCYDVARDGQRFYVQQARRPPPPPVVTHINLVQNWFEELQAKVPGGMR
jgi:serine/threonine-protein kinase